MMYIYTVQCTLYNPYIAVVECTVPLNLTHGRAMYVYVHCTLYNPYIAAVECTVPLNPTHGRVMYNSVSYNSLISYECNYGYMIIGKLKLKKKT